MAPGTHDGSTPTSAAEVSTFATKLATAIAAQRLSLDRIRARLTAAGTPVSVATLSYWQSGRSLPTRAASLRVVTELERVLHIEPGGLTALADQERQRRAGQAQDWEQVVPVTEVARGTLARMGFPFPDGELSRVSIHDTLTVGADRTEATQQTRQVLRATHPGARRWPIVLWQDAERGVVPEIASLAGCSVGEVVAEPDYNLVVAEMVLPRPLARGELVMIEYLVTFGPTDQTSFRLERSCAGPVRELVLEARFPPGDQPDRVVAFSRQQVEDAHDLDLRELPLVDGVAQHVLHDVEPSVYGLRWTWS